MTIDSKDREILFNLSLNARASLTKLGKATRLSKEVVHYRLRKLEKAAIIQGYYAVINSYKLGMTFYRVYVKTVNMTTATEKRFVTFLKRHPKVTWVVEVDGDLDFLYVVWAENIIEFQQVYNEINDKFGKYFQQKFFSVMTNVYYFKDKYLVGKEDETAKITGGKIERPKLDSIDSSLITLLSTKGRLPVTEIGKKLKTSAKIAQHRIKKLLQLGIITCFNVKINHKALGYTQRKVMLNLNDNSQETTKKLISYLNYHRLTIYITVAIGQYDIEFEMMEKRHDEFHEMIKDLKNNFPGLIRNYFTVIFYDEPKVGQMAAEA